MNQNETAKEVCLRQQGKGKGINITEGKEFMRHLADLEVEQMVIDGIDVFNLVISRKTPMMNMVRAAISRYKKANKHKKLPKLPRGLK